jgi:hypothetical protein
VKGPEPHEFKTIRGFPWPVCTGCGLVKLRNAITEWCVRHGCAHAERPEYKATLARLTERRACS